MANEWPANESEDWDDAISANLTTGGSHDASTGMHPLGVLSGFKTITFTRDMTAASGDVAYTGVGFQPRQVVFFASLAGTPAGSWGVDDGTAARRMDQRTSGTMDNGLSSILFNIVVAGGFHHALITTLDSDGFTLTWTKSGSPTGTATIIALCLK